MLVVVELEIVELLASFRRVRAALWLGRDLFFLKNRQLAKSRSPLTAGKKEWLCGSARSGADGEAAAGWEVGSRSARPHQSLGA